MEGYHSDSSLGLQTSDCRIQGWLNPVKFLVDLYPDCLERPCRRMNPTISVVHWNGIEDHILQLSGGPYGIFCPGIHNGLGYSSGITLLAIVVDHIGKIILTVFIDHLIGGKARIHTQPHVEDLFLLLKAEAALGFLIMEYAYSKIEENEINCPKLMIPQIIIKPCINALEAVAKH